MPRTLVVTPTYNEKDNLTRFVDAVRGALPDADLLVVDDDSPDGTGELADVLAAADPKVRVLHRANKLGLGTAYLQAFARGLAEGYERFFEMDADLSHDVRYLPDFVRALDEGYDVVIGSRNIPGGGVEGWGVGRHIISKGGSLYSRTILGLPVHDLTSGYKAFSRQALEAIALDQRVLVPDRDDLPRPPPRDARQGGPHRLRRSHGGPLEDEPAHLRRSHRHGVEAPLPGLSRAALKVL